jgi:large subunit ribosomal protein L24
MRIHKGDLVQVLSGKHRGKRGHVMVVLPEQGKVIVDGANMAKRHTKPRGATMQGGIIDKDMPLPVSSVAIICSTDGPTRVGYRFEDSPAGPRKVRICRKCGGDI